MLPNTFEHETEALIAANGFRDTDARWLFGSELNLCGAQVLGLGLGTYLHELGVRPRIVTGHDYRSYSAAVKHALQLGLIEAGCEVVDIGLALSPMAYFARGALDCPAVAMVTASHNENGWTGVKMGAEPPFTFGSEEMRRLAAMVLCNEGRPRPGGSYRRVPGFRARYVADLVEGRALSRRLRVVAACGNGTAGAFAPEALRRIGADVIALDAEPDFTFPRYNPNPEDLAMLDAMSDAVRREGADIALGFDGDGDRCGVVDERGSAVFADKMGVLLARDLSSRHAGAHFLADVKSTAIYASDPVLMSHGASTEYVRTGHSHIKRRMHETGALAAFEKSGHCFFAPPLGRGYDDALLAAIAILEMLDRAQRPLSALVAGLPITFASPTMSRASCDRGKHRVVAELSRQAQAGALLDEPVASVVTTDGLRVALCDGTWGLVRASSNKPALIVVVESPVSEARMHAMFEMLEARLSELDGIGVYDQRLVRTETQRTQS